MTRSRPGRAAVLAAVGLAATSLAWAVPYREGPPVAHTGGFGEPTCRECHFGSPLNAEPGRVGLEVPGSVEAGRTYDLTVTLEHPGMEASGFQLAVRFSGEDRAGEQAGTLSSPSGAVAVTVDTASGVAFAHQTAPGSVPSGSGRAEWTVRWRAPSAGPAGGTGHAADVVIHVAANAANDDASEFGDQVYIASARARVVPVR